MKTHHESKEFPAFPHISHAHMQTLLKCYSICSSCARMCIEEGMKNTAVLCSDCADVCALAIKLHSNDSEFSEKIMRLCSDVCERCGNECAKNEMEHCQQCSEICKECAKACKEG